MRALEPDRTGYVDRDGVKLHFEVFGDEEPTFLLMPSWTIINARFWKAQVPYLARHHRVVTYDGPGNGPSDRPLDPMHYHCERQGAAALAVLDATGTDRAVLVSLSMASQWALWAMAHHPERVLGGVFIGPSLDLAQVHAQRAQAVRAFDEPYTSTEGWAKYNRHYWLDHYQDFLEFFFSQCFTEPHSTKQIEDAVGWGLETTPQVLVAERQAPNPDEATLRGWCARVRAPVLVIHGDEDAISASRRGKVLAEATGGQLVSLEGAGHIPQARDPVKTNLLLRDFAERVAPATPRPRRWSRAMRRPRRALYLSSPIGLGHARRDAAVAKELRRLVPDLQVDWLAQHPVTQVLDSEGERVHPASHLLASESTHIEHEATDHDLNAFQAIRRMDEILVANFMVFHDVLADGGYDLVVGDEAWDVDYFWHENPELKRTAFCWMTDFVGWVPMPEGGDREAFLTADYNAEMIEQVDRFPRVRDRALFVGNPDDIVPLDFGPGLPPIRDWTEAHYQFTGYVTGFDPAQLGDREELRHRLGYRPDERVVIVTVGGSGVGQALLRRVVAAYPEAARQTGGLRMIAVAGPRIDPRSLDAPAGVEVVGYVPDLHHHLAASDLAVVQGGLTTCMELVASRRPFLYFPLRNHFEQNVHVAHRLDRYRAGRRMDYATSTPETIAAAITAELARPADYRPVETDGATRAATLIAELL
jgi:pimeloyl-ACP methyl ester carboxylesterase/predicted glycosyltransferase